MDGFGNRPDATFEHNFTRHSDLEPVISRTPKHVSPIIAGVMDFYG